ncbi:PREDICTED: LOW QUALITY PROTEIN: myocardial zonula adherens protein-like [Gekko japonicus]|uniref:LOW QUALITY PROTEIN: myocardial zonula adherens protein-like n=1 Tax=Gekko japonicus TaxID=146911 RepID=A0ABM1JT62_GEKJA|nr:PREDICTED: LOW QUALITY PROTEIN: myocardial zonula adherens protein-like [Gekko japonicus]
MLRYSSGVTLTTTTPRKPDEDEPGGKKRANVCRLRLTLPPEEGSLPQEGKSKTERTRKHLFQVPNGLPAGNLSHGVVYGVVRRSDNNHNKEMVVYGWSMHQLKEEMKYIRDVRLTLERARKKMYGEYDEMKRKIQELTNELAVSSTQKESLESHLQVHSAALDSFSEMNSSLTSASIELQKTLVDVTLENTVIRDQIKSLKQTHEQSMEKLKEKQKQLETARVKNELLKLKVECSQEANAEVMREMTRKLYSQYEEKLQEEEQKHKLEKETLIAETNRLLKAIEDANKRMRLTETSLQEKDQKIGDLDQFIQRMEEERHQLQKQLLEYELQLHGANLHSQASRQRSHHLEEATASLRERIRHLDDMVLCQQKKVKHMVEEIELQKRKMKEKELFILQLLEKISFLEGENKELQDRLDYLMETQPKTDVETRDIAVGCDLPLRKFISRLPDKGKKISAFAEKLKVAITQKEEERKRTEFLSTVRLAFQKRQEGLDSSQHGNAASEDNPAGEDAPRTPAACASEALGVAVQNQPSIWATKTRAQNEPEPAQQVRRDSDPPPGKESVSEASAPSGFLRHNPHMSAGRQPHYIEVLERRAKNPVRKKSAFKPNSIPAELSGSSRSSSEAPSPGGGSRLPVSTEERLRREKQHLDDVTAARLPVLHHAPMQLLPLEESIALQVQQKAAYEVSRITCSLFTLQTNSRAFAPSH